MQSIHSRANRRTFTSQIEDEHERRIQLALNAMVAARDITSQRRAWKRMRAGILARGPEHVHQREIELGLEVSP